MDQTHEENKWSLAEIVFFVVFDVLYVVQLTGYKQVPTVFIVASEEYLIYYPFQRIKQREQEQYWCYNIHKDLIDIVSFVRVSKIDDSNKLMWCRKLTVSAR